MFTVCQEAKCPNLSSCFEKNELSFMILGDTCTRNCKFCAVKKSTAETLALNADEPDRIAAIVKDLGLKYAVVTSVTRDDLPDKGARHFNKMIKAIRRVDEDIKVEVLVPDFSGQPDLIKEVIEASPDVFGHNLETVESLAGELRPNSDYRISLDVLKTAKEINNRVITKSSLMLGFGESEEEIVQSMKDLKRVNCDIVTLGQYLAPSKNHYPVKEFINLERFAEYNKIAIDLGFKAVLSGPLVRSSYRAQELYRSIKNA